MFLQQDIAHFMNELKAESNSLHAFIEILKKEESALIAGKLDDIDYLTSDKTKLIRELIQRDDHRNVFFHKIGLSLDRKIIDSWLNELAEQNSEIKALWRELLNLARTAQQFTHSNGLIIANRLQHNQQFLAALHSAAGNTALYGPKGQTYI
ncbi:MAG: flagellar protein FlgN [Nitrosomonas sp.]|uniref:flagella synthesis protein FlgN n=1 Tax=Nitrosomonas sp. TaxID=42353 RepID=UPI0025FE7CEC|nr:flagellar protein FlgN [Nitrosomonas sp.]MBY0475733.1 flagellar protein FlgN [Nitrosomonas sp.]